MVILVQKKEKDGPSVDSGKSCVSMMVLMYCQLWPAGQYKRVLEY